MLTLKTYKSYLRLMPLGVFALKNLSEHPRNPLAPLP